MTRIDWFLLAFVALTAFGGYRRGLIGAALSFAGLIVGAIVGARVAPHFLGGGTHSEYTGLVGLVGAFIGAMVLRLAASIAAKSIRGGLRLLPPLRSLDSIGGLVVGILWGLGLIWIAAAVELQIFPTGKLSGAVRRAAIVHRLDRIAPPHDVLQIQAQLKRIGSL